MASAAGSPTASATPQSPLDVKPILNRQPSLMMKPVQIQSVQSPAPSATSPPLSLTSKEWVIPPRPKPGRKPATDTPPTKRKAQNRAAQRAFRERRAARVGELEDQLKQIEDEHEHIEDDLRADVARLEKEVEQYRADITKWAERCRKLESELLAARQGQTTSHVRPSISRNDSTRDSEMRVQPADNSVGCGNCTLESRCQCIDDAFNAMNGNHGEDVSLQDKRADSPVIQSREQPIKVEHHDAMEIDFTNMYASKPKHTNTRAEDVSPTSAVADPCGFCSDGTPCICAEVAAEQEQAQNIVTPQRHSGTINGPGIRQMAQFTPPPSEGDVSMSSSSSAPPSGCASGPGTCAQCRADPNSTLFCKSLAASRAQAGLAPVGCCGGKAANGACCQSSVPLPARSTRSRAAISSQAPKQSVTLTCADAYTTLSRHPAYERASSDIATWLPKLHPSEAPRSIEGRPALEIDAANVMAVLKDFDRRFGQSR